MVLVTGCRSGIGYETALAFARRGDRVYATLRDPSTGGRLRDAVAAERLPVLVAGLDVTDGDAIVRMTQRVIADEGRIDVLINNAGVAGTFAAIEELDESEMRASFETNFWGPFRLCRAVLPHMRAAGSGVIVNLSTIGVELPGTATMSMYATSKVALTRLTETLQSEVSPFGIRVLAAEPGMFATNIYDAPKRSAVDPRSPYSAMVAEVDGWVYDGIAAGAEPAIVAAALVAAVDDPATPTRFFVGADAVALVAALRDGQMAEWNRGRATG